jgi:hypothetical protein
LQLLGGKRSLRRCREQIRKGEGRGGQAKGQPPQGNRLRPGDPIPNRLPDTPGPV